MMDRDGTEKSDDLILRETTMVARDSILRDTGKSDDYVDDDSSAEDESAD